MAFVVRIYRAPGAEPLSLVEATAYFDRQPGFSRQTPEGAPPGSAWFVYENALTGLRFWFLFDARLEEECLAYWESAPADEPLPTPTPLTLSLEVNRPPAWAQEAFPLLEEAAMSLHLWARAEAAPEAAPVDVDALIERWNATNAAAGWRPRRRWGCLPGLFLGGWR